jgi:hypothetical protein
LDQAAESRTTGSIWTSWVLPLIIVAGLVGAGGMLLTSVLEIPFARACLFAVPAILGLFGYFFAEQWLYAAVSRPLGYQCEMRPQPKPHSAQYDADLVITETFRGHRFTLYRERHNSLSNDASSTFRPSGPIIRSVVEWSDPAFTMPAFEATLGPAGEAAANPFGIRTAMESAVSAVRAASGHPTVARPGEPAGFPESTRDQLTAIMARGTIEGEPGYLVLRETARSPVWTSREGKFPYPWELQAYLDRADRIRRALAPA